MAAPVSPALLIALVTGSLGQFLCLGFRQLVEGLLYAASHKFLELSLDYFLVKLYDLLRHGLLFPFRIVCRGFILPEFCKPCLFCFCETYSTLSFYLIRCSEATGKAQARFNYLKLFE